MMVHCVTVRFIILHYRSLHLHCHLPLIMLHYIALHDGSLRYSTVHILHYRSLHLHCHLPLIMLQYIALHDGSLRYSTVHYITLPFITFTLPLATHYVTIHCIT